MASLQNPPYQDPSDSQRWADWYRRIQELLQSVSQTINSIDDVEVVGATQGDILQWNATESEWQNTETPVFPSTVDIEGALTQVGAATFNSTLDAEGNVTIDEANLTMHDGSFIHDENGNEFFQFATTGGATGFWQIRNTASTTPMMMSAAGASGLNVGMAPTDGGYFIVRDNFLNVFMLVDGPDTEAIESHNWVHVRGADTGSEPFINAAGDDTNVGLTMSPKGSGVIRVDEQIMGPATAVTASSIAVDSEVHRYLICDGSSNAIDVELPAASTAGSGYRLDVKAIDVTNATTINEAGTDEIDAQASVVINVQYDNVSLLCDGSTWHII